MRIQMRLSQESEFILRKEKEEYRDKEDISVTYGWLVNKATKHMFSLDINKIDWIMVRDFQLKLFDEPKTSEQDFSTTLNLEKTVLEHIQTLQILFKDEFNASRIHKAFAVRMLIKADLLIKAGHNIFKEEE